MAALPDGREFPPVTIATASALKGIPRMSSTGISLCLRQVRRRRRSRACGSYVCQQFKDCSEAQG